MNNNSLLDDTGRPKSGPQEHSGPQEGYIYRFHRGMPLTLAGVGLTLALFGEPGMYLVGATMFLGSFLMAGTTTKDNHKPTPVWVRVDRRRYRA